jgi:hypothetical protein
VALSSGEGGEIEPVDKAGGWKPALSERFDKKGEDAAVMPGTSMMLLWRLPSTDCAGDLEVLPPLPDRILCLALIGGEGVGETILSQPASSSGGIHGSALLRSCIVS